MIKGKKVVVVMPAYNAEKTLRRTYAEIPHDIVDEVVLVDDASQEHTVAVSHELGVTTVIHPENLGYGGNQKTCYRTALARGADIVIMLHPDYQYTPLLITAMASLLAEGLFDCVLGSRILGVGAREAHSVGDLLHSGERWHPDKHKHGRPGPHRTQHLGQTPNMCHLVRERLPDPFWSAQSV